MSDANGASQGRSQRSMVWIRWTTGAVNHASRAMGVQWAGAAQRRKYGTATARRVGENIQSADDARVSAHTGSCGLVSR